MLYICVFPWLSTTLGEKCTCFNTPSDVLVELPCIVKYFLQYEACKTVNWASTYRSCLCLSMLVDVDVIQKFKWIKNNIIFKYYNWPLTSCCLLRQNWCGVMKRHTAFEMLCTVHWFKNQQLQNTEMWLKSVWYCRVQVSYPVTLNGFHSFFNNGLRQRNDTKEWIL